MRSRQRWLAVGIITLVVVATAIIFVPRQLPLREKDKVEAARALVAWIVDNQTVPGFSEAYPDTENMPGQKQFFVLCDFVPAAVPLSSDRRVQRISEQQYDGTFTKHGFEDTDYIEITLKSETDKVLVLEFSNSFGSLAAHGYTFEFRRFLWGLRASGEFEWVS